MEFTCIQMGQINWPKWKKKKFCEVNRACGAFGGLQSIYILHDL